MSFDRELSQAVSEELPPIQPNLVENYWPNLHQLLQSYPAGQGQLVDLGGGLQPYGEALAELGLYYATMPLDQAATNLEKLENWLDSLRPITLLCLSDLGALVNPSPLLTFLAHYARQNAIGGLVTGVPNLAHQDLATRLLNGRGLDRSELMRYFTHDTLLDLFEGSEWEKINDNNVIESTSRNYDPALLLHKPTLAGDVVRSISRVVNPYGEISDFVWLLKPRPRLAQPADYHYQYANQPAHTPTDQVLSVMIRTQGKRNELLTECLYSIYVQDFPLERYEILITLQTPAQDTSALERFKLFMQNFPPELVARIKIIPLHGEGRPRPLNVLLEHASGQYIFFLDDDDLLMDGCLQTLAQAVEQYGQDAPVLHTLAIRREIEVVDWQAVTGLPPDLQHHEDKAGRISNGYKFTRLFNDPDIVPRTYPYAVSRIHFPWKKPYQNIYQHFDNEIHPTCFIFPRLILEQTNLRVNEEFIVYQDWEFFMRVTNNLKVVSLPEFTACVNVRTNGTNAVTNSSLVLGGVWKYFHEKCLSTRSKQPLVFEGRAVFEIVEHFNRYKNELEHKQPALLEKQRIELENQHQHQIWQEQAKHRTEMENTMAVFHKLEDDYRELCDKLNQTETELHRRKLEISQFLDPQTGELRLKAQLQALQNEADSYRQQADDRQVYASSLEKALAEVQSSPSWKLTAPIRLLRSKLSRWL